MTRWRNPVVSGLTQAITVKSVVKVPSLVLGCVVQVPSNADWPPFAPNVFPAMVRLP
jgi:hypothetical protein